MYSKAGVAARFFGLAAVPTVNYNVYVLENHPPPLASQVAGITADLRATADLHAAQAGLVAALRALILATLARLFTHLEGLIALWQSGQLPAPENQFREHQNRPDGPAAKRTSATAGQGEVYGAFRQTVTKSVATGPDPVCLPVTPASRASVSATPRAQRPVRRSLSPTSKATTQSRPGPWPRAGPHRPSSRENGANHRRKPASKMLLYRN